MVDQITKNMQLQTINKQQQQLQLNTVTDLERFGKLLSDSGFFSDVKGAAQAVVKILAGRELGFTPIASMTGIYVVKGRVTLGSNLVSAAIKKSHKYNYRVVELTNKVCIIDFFENGQKIGSSSFDEKDAQDAGLLNNDNYKKFRRNMLYARALTNGARWYCSEIFSGSVALEGEGEDIQDIQDIQDQADPTIVTPVDVPNIARIQRLRHRIEQLWLEEDSLELLYDQAERLDLQHKTETELEALGSKISKRIKQAKDLLMSKDIASF